ncbi:MAG: hypothetical protein R6V85_14825 [Polyangia bacterium]
MRHGSQRSVEASCCRLSRREIAGWAALAIGLAVAIAVAVLALVPDAMDPGNFGRWMPALAGASAAGWLVCWIVERRLGRAHPAFTAAFGALALAVVFVHGGQRLYGSLSGDYLRTWNVYHYYVGSKYFRELGYRDLYAATLAADDEWLESGGSPSEGFAHVDRTRDMASYEVIDREQATAGYDRSAFGDERWEQLGRDTRALRSHLADRLWKKVLRDWGYNPPPSWTIVGTPLSNLIPADSSAMRLIANLDLLLFAAMFGFLWWAFGLRAALIATLWANLIHFNRGRFFGGFLQYDWLASSVISVCLYHRGRGAAAGAMLSWGAMTRFFPGLMALPIALGALAEAVRGEGPLWKRPRRRRLRFLAGLAIACAVLFGASTLTGRGARAWDEWIDNIARHSEVLHLDPMHLGAGRLAQHDPADDDFWGGHHRGSREERLESGKNPLLAMRLFGGLLLLVALLRRRDEDAMILVLLAAFLAVTMTRYYGTIWVLLFLLGVRDRLGRIPWPSLVAGSILLTMAALFYAPGDNWARYTLACWEALALLVVLCGGYIASDVKDWITRGGCARKALARK